MDEIDRLIAFRWSLAETIAWCASAPLTHPETALRSAELRPPSPLSFELPLAERQTCVAEVAAARTALRRAGRQPTAQATDLAGGRLLLFAPDDTLSDGAVATSTEGFFDDDNLPPWDT